jgi:hypothetical protein
LPAPTADEAAEAIRIGAVVGPAKRGGWGDRPVQRDKTLKMAMGLGFLLGENVGRAPNGKSYATIAVTTQMGLSSWPSPWRSNSGSKAVRHGSLGPSPRSLEQLQQKP